MGHLLKGYNVVSIVGARPNFVKLKPIHNVLEMIFIMRLSIQDSIMILDYLKFFLKNLIYQILITI